MLKKKMLPSDHIKMRMESKERLREMAEALAVHWDIAAIDRQKISSPDLEDVSPDELTKEQIEIAHAYGSVIAALNSF